MQFRRQCRLHDIAIFQRIREVVPGISAALVGLSLAGAASAGSAPVRLAQLGPNGGPGPSYGYQPYNDRNPTGFYHPNGTGYGHYYLTQKHHAPRIRAFRYRKFRGV